jgi:aminoglycoside phosphotransferase (APT) family kinase protein
LVPGTGIEPVRQFDPPTDFKSVVSTYFTTRARQDFHAFAVRTYNNILAALHQTPAVQAKQAATALNACAVRR